jgi:DNA-binding YbaB/EbfC family protein
MTAGCRRRHRLHHGLQEIDMSEPGMMDMMRQAREMQKKMKQAQKRMAKTEITAEAGGGMVSVVINGKLEVRGVTIDPALFTEGDVAMIQDLVTSAVNAAIQKAQDVMAEEMKQVTGGLDLGGLGIPGM